MLKQLGLKICGAAARYLQKTSHKYEPFSVSDPAILHSILRPADVLLVEGNQRVSVAIKYLTQSTWSHAALYVDDALPPPPHGSEPNTLIEVDLTQGVTAVPLSKYATFSTRICRPVGLSDLDRRKVVEFTIDNLGMEYDLQNAVDLVRYFLPALPVPVRWRRRMLALGSGDPTRAICSTLIAQAFQSIHYPILPQVETRLARQKSGAPYTVQEILHIRHHSLFTPRDFDLSPYFQVVKPTIETGFDHRQLVWNDEASTA